MTNTFTFRNVTRVILLLISKMWALGMVSVSSTFGAGMYERTLQKMSESPLEDILKVPSQGVIIIKREWLTEVWT